MLSTKVSQEVARAFAQRAAAEGTTRNGLLKQMVHDLVASQGADEPSPGKRHLHRPGAQVDERWRAGGLQVQYVCRDCGQHLPWRNA